VVSLLSACTLLILNGMLYGLHLSKNQGSFPKPLSAREEREYLERYAAGDIEARNVLIERNMRLVAHIIKKYWSPKSDQEDLISIGTIGLIKGISSFKPSKGVRLATYASKCIENEILMHFRSQKKSSGELLLSDSIDTDKDGNALSLLDVISVDDNMLDDIAEQETRQELRIRIDQCLTVREADIIKLRYGIGGKKPLTQREIAERCGISRSYVSRIEKRALEKLEQALREG